MNLLIISSLISLNSAALLPSKSYIPQNQGPGWNGQVGNEQYGNGQVGNGQYGSHSGSGDTGNRRPQQDAEKNAAIVKQDQKLNEDGSFHFGYETSNGIRAEEAGNPAHTQGGFAYQGDDGHTYTVTYTSGDGGFVPQGDHLPVPPPTPEAILEALKQNERDEAAGIFDDGKYHPDKQGGSQGQGQFGSNHQRPLNRPAPGFESGPPPSHQGSFNQNTGYNY